MDYLFLDDERIPSKVGWVKMPDVSALSWRVVKNYEEFVAYIEEKGLPKFISFDHDLAAAHYPQSTAEMLDKNIPYEEYKEKTGYHCAQWLIEYCQKNNRKLPPYQVHSLNPVGAENIRSLLENAREFLGI